MKNYNFRVLKPFATNQYALYVSEYDRDNPKKPKRCLSEKGWVDVPECADAPTITINAEDLIKLANELWENKIKPPEFFNSVGEEEATKKHLEDMREIAFFKLGMLPVKD